MRLSLFLIASAAFAASSAVAAEPIKVPLFRRHSDSDGVVHADAEKLENGVVSIHISHMRIDATDFIKAIVFAT